MTRALTMLLALPFGLLMGSVLWLVRATARPRLVAADLPDDAILYFTHLKIWNVGATREIARGGKIGGAWLGFHGFLPYVFVVTHHMLGLDYFLYDRRRPLPPMEQVRIYLQANPRARFGIATDSGGPYGQVRPSLAKLGLATRRPLVAFSVHAESRIRLFGHELAVPFSKLIARCSPPIPPERLAGLSEEAATALLQSAFDEVNRPLLA